MEKAEATQAAEAIWNWAIEAVQAIERGDTARVAALSTAIGQANMRLAELTERTP